MSTDPHIPGPLGDDLRRTYRAAVPVPRDVDAAMLAAAAGRARSRRVPLGWRVTKWVGIAAAVVLAFVVPTQLSRNPQPPVVVAGDVNRDGAIDILDAFVLARAQRDGDASITKADIDAAAARAVHLGAVRGGGA